MRSEEAATTMILRIMTTHMDKLLQQLWLSESESSPDPLDLASFNFWNCFEKGVSLLGMVLGGREKDEEVVRLGLGLGLYCANGDVRC